MLSQQQVIATLPEHLQCFVATQDYDRYTPRDHAVWRFVLRQLIQQLQGLAHPTFFKGLQATGITIEHIPRIESINHAMQQLGWRAVVVDGFLPPAIFMEFQAHCVLPIAVDIRSLQHILYTPAPDIIHETVGHAPFIVDVDYAEFLQRVGELGMRAISSCQDYAIYEAVRRHSIIMESPTASEAERECAECELQRALQAGRGESEAALLSRLHWWTVEYGLVGDPEDCSIFGAGLLSSLGESGHCLQDSAVKKLRLTVDAIRRDYDITHQQPQLYVTHSCRHLRQVLEAFAQGMAWQCGGAESVRKAIASQTINTVKLDTGLEISAKFTEMVNDAMDNVCYLQTQGATQLAYEGHEIEGQGTEQHRDGYGTALGKVCNMTRCLSELSIDELRLNDIEINKTASLPFVSGITVSGTLQRIIRRHNRNVMFSFSDCRVFDNDGRCYFQPQWGVYDLAIGEEIVSVYGGASDKSCFVIYSQPSAYKSPQHSTGREDEQLLLYRQLRENRERDEAYFTELNRKSLTLLCEKIAGHADWDWLLYQEALELAVQLTMSETVIQSLRQQLDRQLQRCEPELLLRVS